MVASTLIHTSNTSLPAHLTAIFIGGTSGIGEYTVKAFAKYCAHPKTYIIGRSQEAADRILANLKTTNPDGEYHIIKSDISLLKKVDKVCQEIKDKEKHINILFLSQGAMITAIETEEGLHLPAALVFHSRIRFILNLLPLLQAAPTGALRRVVSIFAGTLEGPITDVSNLQLRGGGMVPIKLRGQANSTVTISLEHIAKKAPDVSFIHDFPGPVKSNVARYLGVINFILRAVFKAIGPFVYLNEEESGERHLFLATSARFPSKNAKGQVVDVEVARGSDGEVGSGVYIVDAECESGGEKPVEVLKKIREKGTDGEIWEQIMGDFRRIAGKESM